MLGVLFFGIISLTVVEGTVDLLYQPKYCIKDPCPQFDVVAINGQKQSGLYADLLNLDPKKSALSSFRKIRVSGTWTQEDTYLKITVKKWNAVVGEKISD